MIALKKSKLCFLIWKIYNHNYPILRMRKRRETMNKIMMMKRKRIQVVPLQVLTFLWHLSRCNRWHRCLQGNPLLNYELKRVKYTLQKRWFKHLNPTHYQLSIKWVRVSILITRTHAHLKVNWKDSRNLLKGYKITLAFENTLFDISKRTLHVCFKTAIFCKIYVLCKNCLVQCEFSLGHEMCRSWITS